MKKRKKILGPFIFTLILFILYFIFFPYETEKELSVKPHLVHYLGEDTAFTADKEDKGIYSFKTGDVFGYLDNKGKILFKERVLYNVALSDRGFINYSSIQNQNQNLVLIDVLGNFRQSYSLPGYPFFSDRGSRLFIIRTDATGIREVTLEGDEVWQAGFASLITGSSSNDEYTLVGFLNGILKVFNKAGENIYNYTPEGSRLSVIYGTAMSKNSKTMAVLSGIDPQNLLFFRKGRANYHHPVIIGTSGELRRPAFMEYTYNDKYLLFESEQHLTTLDVDSLKTYSLPVRGRLISVDAHHKNQFIAASFLKPDSQINTDLYIYKPGNKIYIKKMCKMKIDFLRFIEHQLIAGFDEILLVFNIREI